MIMRNIFIAALMCAFLVSSFAHAQEVPSCADGTNVSVPSDTSKHKVRLTWQASVPANAKKGNQVAGYNVYRSESGHCERPGKHCTEINRALIKGTSCVDYEVRSGRTYTYRAQAVSVSAAASGLSNEAKATIP